MPISLYGASKLASESLITAWAGTFGAKGFIHRFANIVGPRGTHGVIFDFIHKLKSDPSRLEVLGDGNQRSHTCLLTTAFDLCCTLSQWMKRARYCIT